MRKASKKKRIAYAILCGALVLASAACFVGVAWLSRLLPSQQAAERWQGEGEAAYAQVSCFLAADERISLNEIYKFRYAILDKLHDAGYAADTDTRLFRDAWCATGKVQVSSGLGHGEASVHAVGGHYFEFHPIHLISGSYISEDDLMKDRVLLDEDLAWLLFGGTELEGMELRINGVPFVVAGVIQREQDFASRRAYSAGMGLYMSYDAYVLLDENAAAECYELVLVEPVEGFTLSFVKEQFPIGQGEIVDNSKRFTFNHLLSLVGQFGTRSMQTQGVAYPYWENAARAVEDWCMLLLLLGLMFAVLPAMTILVLLVWTLKHSKEKLANDVLPKWKDKAGDAVRAQQRKHWEKKHPGED